MAVRTANSNWLSILNWLRISHSQMWVAFSPQCQTVLPFCFSLQETFSLQKPKLLLLSAAVILLSWLSFQTRADVRRETCQKAPFFRNVWTPPQPCWWGMDLIRPGGSWGSLRVLHSWLKWRHPSCPSPRKPSQHGEGGSAPGNLKSPGDCTTSAELRHCREVPGNTKWLCPSPRYLMRGHSSGPQPVLPGMTAMLWLLWEEFRLCPEFSSQNSSPISRALVTTYFEENIIINTVSQLFL